MSKCLCDVLPISAVVNVKSVHICVFVRTFTIPKEEKIGWEMLAHKRALSRRVATWTVVSHVL